MKQAVSNTSEGLPRAGRSRTSRFRSRARAAMLFVSALAGLILGLARPGGAQIFQPDPDRVDLDPYGDAISLLFFVDPLQLRACNPDPRAMSLEAAVDFAGDQLSAADDVFRNSRVLDSSGAPRSLEGLVRFVKADNPIPGEIPFDPGLCELDEDGPPVRLAPGVYLIDLELTDPRFVPDAQLDRMLRSPRAQRLRDLAKADVGVMLAPTRPEALPSELSQPAGAAPAFAVFDPRRGVFGEEGHPELDEIAADRQAFVVLAAVPVSGVDSTAKDTPVLTHEIGHLLGARHTDDPDDPFPDATGFAEIGDPQSPRCFRTVMSTPSDFADSACDDDDDDVLPERILSSPVLNPAFGVAGSANRNVAALFAQAAGELAALRGRGEISSLASCRNIGSSFDEDALRIMLLHDSGVSSGEAEEFAQNIVDAASDTYANSEIRTGFLGFGDFLRAQLAGVASFPLDVVTLKDALELLVLRASEDVERLRFACGADVIVAELDAPFDDSAEGSGRAATLGVTFDEILEVDFPSVQPRSKLAVVAITDRALRAETPLVAVHEIGHLQGANHRFASTAEAEAAIGPATPEDFSGVPRQIFVRGSEVPDLLANARAVFEREPCERTVMMSPDPSRFLGLDCLLSPIFSTGTFGFDNAAVVQDTADKMVALAGDPRAFALPGRVPRTSSVRPIGDDLQALIDFAIELLLDRISELLLEFRDRVVVDALDSLTAEVESVADDVRTASSEDEIRDIIRGIADRLIARVVGDFRTRIASLAEQAVQESFNRFGRPNASDEAIVRTRLRLFVDEFDLEFVDRLRSSVTAEAASQILARLGLSQSQAQLVAQFVAGDREARRQAAVAFGVDVLEQAGLGDRVDDLVGFDVDLAQVVEVARNLDRAGDLLRAQLDELQDRIERELRDQAIQVIEGELRERFPELTSAVDDLLALRNLLRETRDGIDALREAFDDRDLAGLLEASIEFAQLGQEILDRLESLGVIADDEFADARRDILDEAIATAQDPVLLDLLTKTRRNVDTVEAINDLIDFVQNPESGPIRIPVLVPGEGPEIVIDGDQVIIDGEVVADPNRTEEDILKDRDSGVFILVPIPGDDEIPDLQGALQALNDRDALSIGEPAPLPSDAGFLDAVLEVALADLQQPDLIPPVASQLCPVEEVDGSSLGPFFDSGAPILVNNAAGTRTDNIVNRRQVPLEGPDGLGAETPLLPLTDAQTDALVRSGEFLSTGFQLNGSFTRPVCEVVAIADGPLAFDICRSLNSPILLGMERPFALPPLLPLATTPGVDQDQVPFTNFGALPFGRPLNFRHRAVLRAKGTANKHRILDDLLRRTVQAANAARDAVAAGDRDEAVAQAALAGVHSRNACRAYTACLGQYVGEFPLAPQGTNRCTSHPEIRVNTDDAGGFFGARPFQGQQIVPGTFGSAGADADQAMLTAVVAQTVVQQALDSDRDSDGTPDFVDIDDDNDGVRDTEDAFPFDARESVDSDGDGTGDASDADADGDGALDALQVLDANGDGANPGDDPSGGAVDERTPVQVEPRARIAVADSRPFDGSVDIVRLQNGGAVVVFQRQGRVLVQELDAAGQRLSAPVTFGADYVSPALALLESGEVVVAASRRLTDSRESEVDAQRFTLDGGLAPVGPRIEVNQFENGDQDQPQVGALADGGFFVVFRSEPGDGRPIGARGGLFLRLFSADGVALEDEFKIDGFTTDPVSGFLLSRASQPQLTRQVDGSFLVSYLAEAGRDADPIGAPGIFLRLLNAQGLPVGGERRLTSASSIEGRFPVAVGLREGGSVLLYDVVGGSAGAGLGATFAQRVDASGNEVGSPVALRKEPLIDGFRQGFNVQAARQLSTGNLLVIGQADTGLVALEASLDGALIDTLPLSPPRDPSLPGFGFGGGRMASVAAGRAGELLALYLDQPDAAGFNLFSVVLRTRATPESCGATTFYSYYDGADHSYYETRVPEGFFGYAFEGPAFALCQQGSSTGVPYYRFYNGADHAFSVDSGGSGLSGYTFEGQAGFLFREAVPGTVPLYEYFNGTDHGYSVLFADEVFGYVNEGVAGHVFVSPEPGAPDPDAASPE